MPDELDAGRVKGILDAAVNRELKRHTLQPGGDAAGFLAFFCDACQKAYTADVLFDHLNQAVMRALTEHSR